MTAGDGRNPAARPVSSVAGRTTITAVVPAFNEAGRVGRVVEAVSRHVDEVVVVDDGSSDATADEAARCGARVVRNDTRQGQLASLRRGFAGATGDVVVTIDADGEFVADDIPSLTEPIIAGRADMVQGARPGWRRPSERFLVGFAGLRAPVGDAGSGFRALRRQVARQLSLRGACICGTLTLEVLARGYRVEDVPVRVTRVDKRRRIAWRHLLQLFYLLPWLVRNAYGSGPVSGRPER